MTTAEYLADLRAMGFRIWTDDGATIRLDGPLALTVVQRQWLKDHKPDVLAELSKQPWDRLQAVRDGDATLHRIDAAVRACKLTADERAGLYQTFWQLNARQRADAAYLAQDLVEFRAQLVEWERVATQMLKEATSADTRLANDLAAVSTARQCG